MTSIIFPVTSQVDQVEVKQFRLNLDTPSSASSSSANLAASGGGSSTTSRGAAAAAGVSGGGGAGGGAGGGSPLAVAFCAARDLLFVLLPRELLVLDTELGVPAGKPKFLGFRCSQQVLSGVYLCAIFSGIMCYTFLSMEQDE